MTQAPPHGTASSHRASRYSWQNFGYLNRLGREQALADVAACIDWLTAQPQVERIALIGFSAGGHLAYLAACRLPIDRTAVLYGGWLPTTDIPMSRPSPTPERDALRAPGTEHDLVSHPGVEHAFFWPGTPAFNQSARDDAWSRILVMLAD